MKKKIGDILNIAQEVTDKTVADVFVHYLGSVKQLEVRVYANGRADGSHEPNHDVWLEETAQEDIDAMFEMLVAMLPAQPEGSAEEVGA